MDDEDSGPERQKQPDARQIEEQLKGALRIALAPGAYERMMNVRMSNPKLYAAASRQAIAFYQKARRPLSEKEILSVLTALRGDGRETKITFK